IVRYCTWVTAITKEQVTQSITKTFNGTENIEMVNNIQKGMIQEAIEIGERRGELKGMVGSILYILSNRFGVVPQYIVDSLNKRNDVIAMKSLVFHATSCSSLDDFAADL
ncbi:MAG: hypothetical protein LBL39_01935, partial [Planctomycetaceae bacterium]|nr:hypothetical protein [Planctomycetaceae bacterium]